MTDSNPVDPERVGSEESEPTGPRVTDKRRLDPETGAVRHGPRSGDAEAEALAETGAARAAARVTAEVVHLALVGVGEHLVGGRDLLEPVLDRGIGIYVGVQLARELAVGTLDLLAGRVVRHTEDGVQVGSHCRPYCCSVRMRPT